MLSTIHLVVFAVCTQAHNPDKIGYIPNFESVGACGNAVTGGATPGIGRKRAKVTPDFRKLRMFLMAAPTGF
jgi:hypothetical protein